MSALFIDFSFRDFTILRSILLKSKIGDIDLINPIFTSLSNLPLTVGVLIPVEHDIICKDVPPTLNKSDYETYIFVR